MRSVANLTRRDAEEFLTLAGRIPLRTPVQVCALPYLNPALGDSRAGRWSAAAVLMP